jgi:SET domain-containing protein
LFRRRPIIAGYSQRTARSSYRHSGDKPAARRSRKERKNARSDAPAAKAHVDKTYATQSVHQSVRLPQSRRSRDLAFDSSNVEVRTIAGKGRGVFALRPFAPGEVIETAPVIVVPTADWSHIENSILYHYCYAWGPGEHDAAVGLGYTSLYNHSYKPNSTHRKWIRRGILQILALKEIAAGEEVTFNYNGDSGNMSPLWFEVVE